MIIVLLDEPGLFVFPSVDAAVQQIEPIDAESEVRAIFDDSAVPYRVEWIRPRRQKILFGLLESDAPGEYCFVPAGPPEPAALLALLEAHPRYTEPPEAHAGILDLLAKLRNAVTSRLKIIFVENHDVFAKTVADAFLAAHSVEVFPTVAAAMAAVAATHYDVALVDYDLDDLKGDEFVRRLRATSSTMLVVGVSARAEGNEALLRAGADATCPKLEFSRIGVVLQNFRWQRAVTG